MELHEFHIHEVGAGVVGQRVPIAGVLPTVTRDLVGTPDSPCCQDNGLCLEQQKPAALAVITKSSDNTISIFQERDNRALHVYIDPLVYSVILKSTDHLQTCAIAHVGETRIFMSTKIPLQNPSVFRSIENCAPGF